MCVVCCCLLLLAGSSVGAQGFMTLCTVPSSCCRLQQFASYDFCGYVLTLLTCGMAPFVGSRVVCDVY